MPRRVEYYAPEVFLEHNGVKVYHTYYDDDDEEDDQRAPDVFTLHPEDTDPDGPLSFNALDLPVPAIEALEAAKPSTTQTAVAKAGMRLSLFRETPAYAELMVQWLHWWDELRPPAIRQAVIEALDKGILK